jgi:G3E family GTPase
MFKLDRLAAEHRRTTPNSLLKAHTHPQPPLSPPPKKHHHQHQHHHHHHRQRQQQVEVTYGQLSPELETASKLMDLAVAHAARRLGALYEGEGGMVAQVLLRSPVREE